MSAHFLPDEARARFAQDRFDAVERIAQVASENGAQFVVACGDLFDSNQVGDQVLGKAIEALRAFSVPVLLLPGNHDPLREGAALARLAERISGDSRLADLVQVLSSPGPHQVAPGVEVVAAPLFTKHIESDPVAAVCQSLEAPPPGVVRIVAGHGAVSTLNPDRTQPDTIDVPALRQVISSGLAHAAVLGDRHSTTEVAPAIWYPGTPEVVARRETDAGNVLILDIDGQTVTARPIRVGAWSFLESQFRLDSAADVAQFAQEIDQLPRKSRTVIWPQFAGTLTPAARAKLDATIADAEGVFAGIDPDFSDLTIQADDDDLASLNLTGFALDAAQELAATAAEGSGDSDTASAALSLLWRLAGGER
jgi:DNA repair exonuclease SbcCD nuclease subunit